MIWLALLALFFLPPPPHMATVLSEPPVAVTKIAPATAMYVDILGNIFACSDQSYGLYVQPMHKVDIAFYYVAPSVIVRDTDKQRYIATCLLVKP